MSTGFVRLTAVGEHHGSRWAAGRIRV